MAEIIPAVNAVSFEKVEYKIRQVEPFVSWVHIDVADGTFTPNILWHDPADLKGFETTLKIELHLMIGGIDERIRDWLLPNITRAIFHLETAKDPAGVAAACRNSRIQAGISIRPDTPCSSLLPHIGAVDLFQILAVKPGAAGQEFMPGMDKKIAELRRMCRTCLIEVDGGMNLETAPVAAASGADLIAAASAIFSNDNIGESIQDLQEHARQ